MLKDSTFENIDGVERETLSRRRSGRRFSAASSDGGGVNLRGRNITSGHGQFQSEIPLREERPCGRLAPSPTGPLHLGNAWAFLLAWLAARAEGGRVVLRMEDIDPAVPGRNGPEPYARPALAGTGLG